MFDRIKFDGFIFFFARHAIFTFCWKLNSRLGNFYCIYDSMNLFHVNRELRFTKAWIIQKKKPECEQILLTFSDSKKERRKKVGKEKNNRSEVFAQRVEKPMTELNKCLLPSFTLHFRRRRNKQADDIFVVSSFSSVWTKRSSKSEKLNMRFHLELKTGFQSIVEIPF